MLDERFMGPKVEDYDEGPRTVRGRQGMGLPAPSGQTERGVLQLRLRGRHARSELPKDLGVGMEGVADILPRLVGDEGHSMDAYQNSGCRSVDSCPSKYMSRSRLTG
jgi:hypothetical protein